MPCENIYSVTSDNGGNMTLAGQLLSGLAADIVGLDQDGESGELLEDDDNEDEEDIDVPSDGEDDLPLAVVRDQISAGPPSQFTLRSEDESLPEVATIRCAAHTLQLAVKDAMEADAVKKLVEKMRRVAKKLRTKNNANTLRG